MFETRQVPTLDQKYKTVALLRLQRQILGSIQFGEETPEFSKYRTL